jgi:hypothetical protein
VPFIQWSKVPGYHVEHEIHCGEQRLDAIDLILSWFDEKLRLKAGAADHVPKLCLTQDKKHGVLLDEMPRGGEVFAFEGLGVSGGFAGTLENVLAPIRWLTGLLAPQMQSPDPNDHTRKTGVFRPAFYPVMSVTETTGLTGIPRLKAELVGSDGSEPIVFVGISVKRAATRNIELISEQVTPLRGQGPLELDLMAISTRLQPGDLLGISLYSYHDQYRFSHGSWFGSATLSGTVALPLLRPNMAETVAKAQ